MKKLFCYKCGQKIKRNQEVVIPVAESNKDYIKVPFCRECAEEFESCIIKYVRDKKRGNLYEGSQNSVDKIYSNR
jgi:NAD-dependent SIR2 family protein deacetylase